MNEKYNGIDNLDYTIDLDGDTYNLTAADSAWADIARKVENILKIELSTEHPKYVGDSAQAKNKHPIEYDGDNPKELSVVPSEGGTFTGSIEIPDHDITANKKLAVNGNSIENLISEIKGLPTYIWDGEKLNELDSTDDSLSPFRVVIYEGADNDPTGIRFKASDGVSFINCYFLAINLYNGYLSLGHCFEFEDKNTEYISLGVRRSEYTNIIADLDADGTVKEGPDENNNNKNYKRQYDYEDIRNLGQVVYGDYTGDYTSTRHKNGLDDIVRALIETIYGDKELTNNTDYTPGTEGLVKAVQGNTTDIGINTADIKKLSNSVQYHKNIFYGTEDVGNYTFPEDYAVAIGDIYIKYA